APCSADAFSPLNSGAGRLTLTTCESFGRFDCGSAFSLNFAPSSVDSSFHVIGTGLPPRSTPPRQYDIAICEIDSEELVQLARYSASAFGFGPCPAVLHWLNIFASIIFRLTRLVSVLPRPFLLVLIASISFFKSSLLKPFACDRSSGGIWPLSKPS